MSQTELCFPILGRPSDTTRLAVQILFHSLARITLSLNQFPLPCIGSLTVDNRGVISLTNRPITLRLQTLENEGIPAGINRNSTYSATDLDLLDLLRCHDNRIHYQPNSIHNEDDGRQQLAALTIMRATLHHLTNRQYRQGPFFFVAYAWPLE
jgi:hypothetical protein